MTWLLSSKRDGTTRLLQAWSQEADQGNGPGVRTSPMSWQAFVAGFFGSVGAAAGQKWLQAMVLFINRSRTHRASVRRP